MSDEERRSLKHGQETQVDVYGSKEIRYSMKFKIWSSKMHVLTSGWNEFRGDNEFKALYNWVTLWVFRHKKTEKFCFVMIARTFPIGRTPPPNPNPNLLLQIPTHKIFPAAITSLPPLSVVPPLSSDAKAQSPHGGASFADPCESIEISEKLEEIDNGGQFRSKNNNGVGNNHPVVASALSAARHVVLDDEISTSLEALTNQFLGQQWVNGSESFKTAIKKGLVPNISELGKPIDGFIPPKLPPVDALEGLIGECGMPFEKQLTDTDMSTHQGRLSIPQELVEKFVNPLMSEEERRSLKRGEKIQVTAYGSKGIEYPMKFKFRASSKTHVLISGWNEFCVGNKFKARHDWVTVWAFRHKETEKLCFVMMARRFQTNRLVRPPQKKRKGDEMNK
ncbi:hypothetical protein Acr_00g0073140 [Actinidia rufa]|uniref:TF-B3 domain-containing protein n=1 Tax=Actinidia rufa TaxID=165716 RepID=A0A7J0DS67_9ERIC|nr:hypothetical protein Acr_00g0073140 [Actinidia rufa]